MAAHRVLVTVPHIHDRAAPYLRRLECGGSARTAS